MIKIIIGRILRPNPILALFGVLVSLIAGWQIIELLSSSPNWSNLSSITTNELASLIGMLLIALLIARSLINDIWNSVNTENRIVCGTGQAGTSYDYKSLLSKNPRDVIVVAQNMRTLLSDKEYLPTLSRWLGRNTANQPNLTFILCTPKVLGAINPIAREHLKQSVIDLAGFLKNEPSKNRILIRFHHGASSLSAMICDPNSKRRGILVFTPKWSLDEQPANRLYCVIHKWEQENLFTRIAGTIPAMVQNDSYSLDQVCKEMEI